MNNANPRNIMEQLLDQELPPTNEQYLAYRQRLSDGIRKVQKQEKIVRNATQCAWALFAAIMVGGFIVDFNRDAFSEMVRLYLMAATVISTGLAIALLAIYLINYRPSLRHAEQEAMLLSLQRQLHDLRGQIQQSGNRPPTERANGGSSGA